MSYDKISRFCFLDMDWSVFLMNIISGKMCLDCLCFDVYYIVIMTNKLHWKVVNFTLIENRLSFSKIKFSIQSRGSDNLIFWIKMRTNIKEKCLFIWIICWSQSSIVFRIKPSFIMKTKTLRQFVTWQTSLMNLFKQSKDVLFEPEATKFSSSWFK